MSPANRSGEALSTTVTATSRGRRPAAHAAAQGLRAAIADDHRVDPRRCRVVQGPSGLPRGCTQPTRGGGHNFQPPGRARNRLLRPFVGSTCAASPDSLAPRPRAVDARLVERMCAASSTAARTRAAPSCRRRASASASSACAIIDLDTGDQPIFNEDGSVVVVLNGEIYNFRELRERAARTRPPLRHAVRHRGHRPPLRGARRRLRASTCAGMFAFALWDAPPAAARCWRATASARSRCSTRCATAR